MTKILNHPAVLGKAKPSYVYLILKPQFRVSSPPQSQSQAVVCVSTPRKYPRSGYFLVVNKKIACLHGKNNDCAHFLDIDRSLGTIELSLPIVVQPYSHA